MEQSETEGVGIIGPYGGLADSFRRAHTVRPYEVSADLVQRADLGPLQTYPQTWFGRPMRTSAPTEVP